MTVQAHKVSSLTRLSCKIMADKAKRHDRDSSSQCDSSEDSCNNDQKQARKKTKKYKTRYSREWEKTYPFLKACPMSVSEKDRLAHKSSFRARSATVSAKRDRTSAKCERAKARLVSLAANHIK